MNQHTCAYCGDRHENNAVERVCASRHHFKTLSQQSVTVTKAAPKPKAPSIEELKSRLDLPGNGKSRYYAYVGDSGKPVFFQARRHRDTGRIYVDGYAGGNRTLPLTGKQAYFLLTKVVDDQKGAMALFGQMTEHCGRCHITLTDDLSKERGYGPDCWKKV